MKRSAIMSLGKGPWGFCLLIITLMGNLSMAAIIPNVPDLQQPPTGSIGNPTDNACAPTSAANITMYWDTVIRHPNAINVDAGLIGNSAADYLYYFMDTDNWGSPIRMNGTIYPAAVGTYNNDILPGFLEFVRWDGAHPFLTPPPNLPLGKLGFDWTFNADSLIGYNLHVAAINAGKPDIVCFKYWNPLPTGVFVNDPSGERIDFFQWGNQIQDWPNPVEHWNLNYFGEGIGHAVTGVGYFTNYDPDGGGPLPQANWIVCHDNWLGTPRNVAIQWQNWSFSVFSDPGVSQAPIISVAPDSLYHRQKPNLVVTYNNDFSISNTGVGPLIYSAVNTLTWITFAGISNNIPAGGVDNVNITVNTNGIAAGTYLDSLIIYSNDPAHSILHRPKIVILVRPDSLYWKDFNGPDTVDGYMPDFDQNQQGWFAYCGPVAVANSIWWFQGKYPNRRIIDPIFYPNNATGFIQLLASIMQTNVGHPGTYVDNMQNGISQYLQAMGLTDLLYEHTQLQPSFDYVAGEVARCQDVTLLIGFWVVQWVQPNPNDPSQWIVGWKRTGGHYVTSAGINGTDHLIGLSDPFYDNFESGVCPGILRGIHHNHPLGHNDGNSASADIYNINDSTVCSPGGIWELDHAFWHTPGLGTEFMNQNGDSVIISLPWPCAFPPAVGMLFSEIEDAVIVSPYEGTPDIDVIPDSLTYSQLFNTIQTYNDQIIICDVGSAPLRIDSIHCDVGFVSLGAFQTPISAGGCDTIDVTLNTNGISPGIYNGNFHIYSSDPDESIVNKPHLQITVTAPNITVSPDSLAYQQEINRSQNYLDQFTVCNTGNASLRIDSVKCDLSFITIGSVPSPISAGNCDSVDININTNGITPGNYRGNCHIYSNDPNHPVVNKPLLKVTVSTPNIVVSPDSLAYQQEINRSQNYLDQFTVCNTGNASLRVDSVKCDLSFITIGSVPSPISAGSCDSVDININTNGITPGNYRGYCHIYSDDPNHPVVNKPLLKITVSTPNIAVSPDSLAYQQEINRSQNYLDQFTVCNTGNASLRIDSVKCDLSFITIGSVPSPIGAGSCDSVDITINTNGISAGNYRGYCHVYSNDPDQSVVDKPLLKINVTAPDILISPDSLRHTLPPDTTITYQSDFVIRNNGTATLTYTPTNSLSWITMSGILGSLGPGLIDSINIIVNSTGISPGIYHDSVTVTSNDPDSPVLHKPYLTITVPQNVGCSYTPGDINGNHSVNGVDIVYAVNYFKGTGPNPPIDCYPDCPLPSLPNPFFAAGDVNGNCAFNGIDITYFVRYLKLQVPSLLYCTDCPPADLIFNHSEIRGDCLSLNSILQDSGYMFLEVIGDDLHIHHMGAVYQCCLIYAVDYQIAGADITAVESDLSPPCDCVCNFNLESILYDLNPDLYTVRLIGVFGDTIGVDTIRVNGQ